ncbi:divalent cation transporter [Psychromarinibacter sp. C21-152]|uniref:Divalent cation transporter n=1 Tax=Psychromarinibacter sediminicola TaxID=3033385 RepID=A0AAE3NQH0_9RHOB|nr:divalent cation transporter [Psychromarinibacter sediminicola]MDF0600166.1 divalent cation transporter [Psychromarinibacter sediminicola]
MLEAVLYSILAGAMIPLGGVLARVEHIQPRWLEQEFRHFVVAFGGGALIAAVALVLVPQGTDKLPAAGAILSFLGGGVAFALLDRALASAGGGKGQLLAMLADFLPEAVALGALFAAGSGSAPLLALIIALQNLPEGFNAYREVDAQWPRERPRLLIFSLLALLGPAAALLGHLVMADLPAALGVLMVGASGGILYLIFQDIAPQAPLKRHWGPPFGACMGFALGLLGHLVIH